MESEASSAKHKAKPRGKDRAVLRLEDNLSYRMSILNHLMTKATSKIYTSRSLNSHQWKVLSVLFNYGPMQATDVLQWVILDKAAVSRALQELRRLKLIDRTLHSSDARTVIVTLTRTGNQLYAEMADEMAQLQKELFAGVTTVGVSRLFQTFDVLEKRLRQSTTDSSQ